MYSDPQLYKGDVPHTKFGFNFDTLGYLFPVFVKYFLDGHFEINIPYVNRNRENKVVAEERLIS